METLKISDLSVGDWVMVNGKPRKISVLAEVWNGSNEVLVGYVVAHVSPNGYNVVYYKPIEHIKPIPITAEILEKNGWMVIEKEVLGDDYEYDGEKRVWDDYSIDICETKPGVFWYSWRTEYYMWRLEYVHQLQHLIRLAGVDKEIN